VSNATGTLAFLTEPGAVELREYDLPVVAPGALLVEVLAAGVCGSEVHQYAGRHPMTRLALGHEFVGRVIDPSTRPVDSAGHPLREGDRVTATYFQTCLHCRPCSRGEFWLCENAYAGLLRGPDEPPHFVATHGTHYYIAPNQWVFKVPDDVPTLVAASANCALTQVVCGIDRGGVTAGDRLVVQGAGGLGLWATAVAKERGITVVVIDQVPERLDLARRLGADATVLLQEFPEVEARRAQVHELIGGFGADVVMDVTGVPQALAEGIGLLRPGGTMLEIGGVLPGQTMSLDVGALTRSGISIMTVIRYHPRYLLDALGFLSRNVHRLPLEDLIDGVYELADITEALEDASARRVNRAAVVPAGAEEAR
jgi:L-iditol 2-dehydrogenase